jgi:hypothetical protein
MKPTDMLNDEVLEKVQRNLTSVGFVRKEPELLELPHGVFGATYTAKSQYSRAIQTCTTQGLSD